MNIEEIAKKFNVLPLDIALRRHGDNDETKIIFYDTILKQSDYKVLQHIREQALGLPLSMTNEEYLELEQARQECVEKIRVIEDITKKESDKI